MRRRRQAAFEQPSLVPMADMLTNTVGIMLFILIFASLSTGAAVIFKHLPRERPTKASTVYMYCSGARMVHFEPAILAKELLKDAGRPTFSTATEWANKFSSRTIETDELQVSGEAEAKFSSNPFQQSIAIAAGVVVRRKGNQGADEADVKTAGSAFQKLLAQKNRNEDFFFFFVNPDSIAVFRAARDQAAQQGFGVGWTPVGAGEPGRIRFSGGGREAMVQ